MLEGKVAIITGATRGIGYEIAKTYLENKAKVCILGSKSETVETAISKLKEVNSNFDVIGFYPKLTDELELKEVFSKVIEEYGKIDIVVNNAGISSSTKILDYNADEIDRIIDHE